jgi:cytochrome c oxidase subunit 2
MSLPLALLNEIMGLPKNASEHGPTIDHALEFCHWFMLALFLGWTAYFLYVIFRFHRTRHPKANYHGVKSKVSAHIEFSVILIEAILLLGFAIPLWASRVTEFPDKDQALRIRAIGEQFKWNFHYAGPDNTFGRQNTELVTSANPLGLDPKDPAGNDDIVTSNDLSLVNYKATVIEISSKDVIHSLSLHAMRMDQDAIPGMRIPMWFRPIREGTYEVVCAQLCGGGHSQMKADMTVKKPEEFDVWYKDFLQLQHPAGAPGIATPGPTPADAPAVGGTPAQQGSAPAVIPPK